MRTYMMMTSVTAAIAFEREKYTRCPQEQAESVPTMWRALGQREPSRSIVNTTHLTRPTVVSPGKRKVLRWPEIMRMVTPTMGASGSGTGGGGGGGGEPAWGEEERRESPPSTREGRRQRRGLPHHR